MLGKLKGILINENFYSFKLSFVIENIENREKIYENQRFVSSNN